MTNPIWGASELWKPTPKLTFSEREGRNTQVLGSVWKDNFEVSERVALWGNKLCRYMIYTFSVCKGMSNLIYACKFIRFKTVSIFTSFMDSTPTHSVFFCTWSSTRKFFYGPLTKSLFFFLYFIQPKKIYFFFFFFLAMPMAYRTVSQQQLEPLQWQCQVFNLLSHQGTPKVDSWYREE